MSRVIARVTINSPAARDRESRRRYLLAALDLKDAVFGPGAVGKGEVTVDGVRYKLRATLVPADTRSPTPGRASAIYAGRLTLRIDDGRASTWTRSYEVTGRIELENTSVVAAPYRLQLAGVVSP